MSSDSKQRDRLFAEPQQHIVDFAFDSAVADVFPDMIRRSVPGYESLITSLAVIASHYYQEDSVIYDLGCSHGAATLTTHALLGNTVRQYIAVDNSAAMVEHCRLQFDRHMADASVTCLQQDIRSLPIENASVVIINLTLQFLPPQDRQAVLESIYQGLKPGGVLILTEKIVTEDRHSEDIQVALYHRFKSANGYSDLEISQKRTALENVMRLDSEARHQKRLHESGFREVKKWFQCFNFISLLAVR